MSTLNPSNLDFAQCIRAAFDDTTGRLKVDALLTATIIAPPGLEVAIEDTDDSIKIGNGSGVFAQVTGANALKVDGSAVIQPVSGSVSVLNFPASQPVSQSGVWSIGVNNFPATQAATQSGVWTVQQGTPPWSVSQSGAWTTGRTWVLSSGTDSVNIGNFPATQPVSGTLSINNFPISQIVNSTFQTQTDVFGSPANGSTINATSAPLKSYSLQVVISGTVSVWDVRLEGSLDNVNFTQILQHTNTTGDGITVFSGSLLSPCTYIRARCAGFTGLGGSSLTSIILGSQ